MTAAAHKKVLSIELSLFWVDVRPSRSGSAHRSLELAGTDEAFGVLQESLRSLCDMALKYGTGTRRYLLAKPEPDRVRKVERASALRYHWYRELVVKIDPSYPWPAPPSPELVGNAWLEVTDDVVEVFADEPRARAWTKGFAPDMALVPSRTEPPLTRGLYIAEVWPFGS